MDTTEDIRSRKERNKQKEVTLTECQQNVAEKKSIPEREVVKNHLLYIHQITL